MSINAEIVDGYDDPRVLNPLWLWYVGLGDGGKGREHVYKTLGGRWGAGATREALASGERAGAGAASPGGGEKAGVEGEKKVRLGFVATGVPSSSKV